MRHGRNRHCARVAGPSAVSPGAGGESMAIYGKLPHFVGQRRVALCGAGCDGSGFSADSSLCVGLREHVGNGESGCVNLNLGPLALFRPVCQTACKPGSVRRPCGQLDGHSSGTRIAARLARPTRAAGRKCPCVRAFWHHAGRPYSVLLPVGFALPPLLPGARCALTAPFRPCPRGASPCAGGLFSVALSLGSPPPAVSRHRISVEPGLSSTGVAPGSGRPAVWQGPEMRRSVGGVKGWRG